ncbi:MAG TPA: DUF5667 domain-containing protein [Ktedonobacteraceae bacterium]|nr:DUF5667 domain-containing protein [Ktedonobacteraceae bacterium]
MKPLHDRLNDRLEHIESHSWQNGHSPSDFLLQEPGREGDPQVDALVVLARRLRVAPHIQVDPDFAQRLERRMFHRHTELQRQHSSEKRSFFFLFRTHPAFGAALSLCLLLLGLSTGVLALAAQISDPHNQLYALKRWEQHLQIALASNAGEQASLDLQFARDRLTTLSDLADPTHAMAYSQALADLDQQVQTATAAIHGLPTGKQRKHLVSELASLQSDAIHLLRSLLPRLTLSERLRTTGELTQLGDHLPRLTSGILILPPHPHGRVTISLAGSDLQPGAQLLVDGTPTGVTGLFQNSHLIFVVVNWKGEQHPQSLGLIDPDGTAAQTTAMTIKTTDGITASNGKHTGQGNGRQPTATPGTQQDGQSTGQPTQDQSTCPGLSQAQKLASTYQLSPDSQGAAVKAICALHQGTFKGTTSAGTPVVASRAYGYGEIDQLLTSAQYLASQDQTSPGGKLSETNVSSYLAAVLQSCGTAPLQTCLQTPIPHGQPGNHNGQGQGNGHQPTAAPTPHHEGVRFPSWGV